ncbi:hypothetical protein Tco_0656401 [Tanacetum coccineum]|uniref:Uncharacterized protein n=1 Tax=Tanacetum coccineum TaxID=301880 RepID=A0ABQ4X9Y6_9ASTR
MKLDIISLSLITYYGNIITNGNKPTTDPHLPQHLLSFHDAVDARSLWKAIKARFGGNEASKKMQKNLLKQQFETFTIGSREELDSAYERHVVATMIRGQPGLDELTLMISTTTERVYEQE